METRNHQNCTSEGAALTLRQLLGAPCPKMPQLGRVSSEMKVEAFSSKYLQIVYIPGFNQRGSDVPLALLEMLQTLSWLCTPPNQVPILRTSFRKCLGIGWHTTRYFCYLVGQLVKVGRPTGGEGASVQHHEHGGPQGRRRGAQLHSAGSRHLERAM